MNRALLLALRELPFRFFSEPPNHVTSTHLFPPYVLSTAFVSGLLLILVAGCRLWPSLSSCRQLFISCLVSPSDPLSHHHRDSHCSFANLCILLFLRCLLCLSSATLNEPSALVSAKSCHSTPRFSTAVSPMFQCPPVPTAVSPCPPCLRRCLQPHPSGCPVSSPLSASFLSHQSRHGHLRSCLASSCYPLVRGFALSWSNDPSLLYLRAIPNSFLLQIAGMALSFFLCCSLGHQSSFSPEHKNAIIPGPRIFFLATVTSPLFVTSHSSFSHCVLYTHGYVSSCWSPQFPDVSTNRRPWCLCCFRMQLRCALSF